MMTKRFDNRKGSVLVATVISFLAVQGALADHSHDDATRLSEPVEVTDTHETFGSVLPEVDSELSLGDVMAAPADFVDADVQITTKVKQVCQKKGCFFVAQQGEHLVRVSFKDYSFFVPTDISGKTVTLHGQLVAHQMTDEQAAHFNADAGGSNAFKAGPRYEIVAVSVRVPLDS
ncbi:MAG: DUF4920 domain-containing protein [Pseudomonadota bacterium]